MRNYINGLRVSLLVLGLIACATGILGCPTEGNGGEQEPPNGAGAKYGMITVNDTTYPLGYGLIVTTPIGVAQGNHTVIELYTSAQARDNGTADEVHITLYHNETEAAPEADYTIFNLMDDVWHGRFSCAFIMQNGQNLICESGTCKFAKNATGYAININTTAVCTTDGNTYTVKVEYNGPLTSMN